MRLDANKLRDTLSKYDLFELMLIMNICSIHGMTYFNAATNTEKERFLNEKNIINCEDRARFFIFMGKEIEYEIFNRYTYVEEVI